MAIYHMVNVAGFAQFSPDTPPLRDLEKMYRQGTSSVSGELDPGLVLWSSMDSSYFLWMTYAAKLAYLSI